MKFIFISYLNRSGSTYLANMLSRSPDICVCPEAEILFTIFLRKPQENSNSCQIKNYLKLLQTDNKFRLWKISPEIILSEKVSNFSNFLNILIYFQQQYYQNAEYIVFKHNYLLHLAKNEIQSRNLFYINLLREPYSVFASQKSTVSPITGRAMCRNSLSFVDSWNSYIHTVKQLNKNAQTTWIKFEELIFSTYKVMDSIFKFIKSENSWEQIKKNPPELSKWISKEYKPMHRNIDSESISDINNKWKNILSDIEQAIIAKFLNKSDFYNLGLKPAGRQVFWCYIYYLRICRKLDRFRGILHEKRFKNLLNKPC